MLVECRTAIHQKPIRINLLYQVDKPSTIARINRAVQLGANFSQLNLANSLASHKDLASSKNLIKILRFFQTLCVEVLSLKQKL